MNMPKYSKWRKRSKLYCFQKVIFVRPKLSVVQQAQKFSTFSFHDMDPWGPIDVSEIEEDVLNTWQETWESYKTFCHSLSNFKIRSGSSQFFWKFLIFAFFVIFSGKCQNTSILTILVPVRYSVLWDERKWVTKLSKYSKWSSNAVLLRTFKIICSNSSLIDTQKAQEIRKQLKFYVFKVVPVVLQPETLSRQNQ